MAKNEKFLFEHYLKYHGCYRVYMECNNKPKMEEAIKDTLSYAVYSLGFSLDRLFKEICKVFGIYKLVKILNKWILRSNNGPRKENRR